MKSFVLRHASKIIGVLSGFDRVRLRGTLLQFSNVRGMLSYFSYKSMLLKQFTTYAKGLTEAIRKRAAADAEALGRPVEYLNSSQTNKEQRAREIAERDGIESGLICVLRCVEPCLSYEVGPNRQTKRLELRYRPMKCLHQYHYLIDPQLGFLSVRMMTWFPFTIHVCINGREWLARQMDAEGLGYVRRDNCFTDLEDVGRAQQLMDQQQRVGWGPLMNRLTRQVHPLHREFFPDLPQPYYWSVDESEWATDLMFRSRDELEQLYPRLVQHAITGLSSPDVMRFLGHRTPLHGGVNGKFQGQVVSDIRTRPEGVRIKHRAGRNSVKMYNKQETVLRIETTLNDAGPFKVHRKAQQQASRTNREAPPKKAWRPLRKAVADVPRRAQICQGVNDRYLQAMAKVEDDTPLGELTEQLCQPTTWHGRRVRALNLLGDDCELLTAVSRGEFALQGFRNKDLRELLYSTPTADPQEARRRTTAVYRRIRLLLGHKLIHKIPKTHRYQLTELGRTLTAAILHAQQATTSQLLTLAA